MQYHQPSASSGSASAEAANHELKSSLNLGMHNTDTVGQVHKCKTTTASTVYQVVNMSDSWGSCSFALRHLAHHICIMHPQIQMVNMSEGAPGSSDGKESACSEGDPVSIPVSGKPRKILCWEDPLEKAMATHSSTLAWRIPWTEEPGRLQSMGLQRVGHDWVSSL